MKDKEDEQKKSAPKKEFPFKKKEDKASKAETDGDADTDSDAEGKGKAEPDSDADEKGKAFGKGKEKVEFNPTEQLIEFLGEEYRQDILEFQQLSEEIFAELQELDEGLSLAGRIKRRMSMRRNRHRMDVARHRSESRRATMDRIHSRSRRTAISQMKSRFSGGRQVGSLSPSEKARLERLVMRRKRAVDNLARRLVPHTREIEKHRLSQ